MNPTPYLRHDGFRGFLTNPGCGFIAMQNREAYWWQSRMTTAGHRAEPVQLVDLRGLALRIRRRWSA